MPFIQDCVMAIGEQIELAVRQRGFVAHLVARGAAVQAQLALAQGDVAAAVAWADASGLRAADDLSFVREAEYLILVRVWIAQAGGIAPGYITRLLSHFGLQIADCRLEPKQSAIYNLQSAMIEPLSARELEVLRLIARGMSNADIARTLVIAISTVKIHTNSIFGKLQATSRTQASALARDLQLL